MAESNPLPSWLDGPSKKVIAEYVEAVTRSGSPDLIPEPARIAVFDNDGTLWPENPIPIQGAYAMAQLRERLEAEPEVGDNPMVQAALKGDVATLLANHHHGLVEVLTLTHSEMTTEDFSASVDHWIRTARHPRFDRPYDQCTYRPMRELLAFLRSRGFKTFIVSGGGQDFMRPWTERVYGIPPEQVVGSRGRVRYELRNDRPVLVKTMESLFVDDREGKPAGIHEFIGRKPVLAFGNSDGDKAMLEYTTLDNPYRSLGLILHHTDAEREYAYDVNPGSTGSLVEAKADAPKRGWHLVDMKEEWATVFDGG
jgi:phosphoglycolate phosphatase-like HAD superfamily hydrolase